MNQTPTKPAISGGFKIDPLYWLLAAIPVAITLHFMHAPAVWVFAFSCLAIIPLAGLMGRATEYLAETMGAGIGGLLNATFGNAAELIIALGRSAWDRDRSPFPSVCIFQEQSSIGTVEVEQKKPLLWAGESS